MNNWLDAIRNAIHAAEPAVLVTVASVDGSSPREAGAKMLVTRTASQDTVGGGHMEMRAVEIARDMLAQGATTRRLERFALGPSLGQCCGGVVYLAFERIDADTHDTWRSFTEGLRNGEDGYRLVPLDTSLPFTLLRGDDAPLTGALPDSLAVDTRCGCHLVRDADGRRWMIDPCHAWRPQLVLFGAGHVGAALVRALADLPCHVTWVDEREEVFPDWVPANVRVEATDTPEAIVDDAPPGASYLVMTHSHPLDQRLTEAILRRGDAGWFGLIGSKTKRMQFEHRLRERGIEAEQLARMTCPIGIPGIRGKSPAVIAASVCAQLLQVWEREEPSRSARAAATTEF